jgi:hypothetical protein
VDFVYEHKEESRASRKNAKTLGTAHNRGAQVDPRLRQPNSHARRRKPSAAAIPSAAEKGGSRVFPGNCNPSRSHTDEGRAKRSGLAERCGKGGFGSPPPTTVFEIARMPKKAKPSAEARPTVIRRRIKSPISANSGMIRFRRGHLRQVDFRC